MRFFVTGGAGFLGSNLVYTLLARDMGTVTVFDNFSTGKLIHFDPIKDDKRLSVVEGDASDLDALCAALKGHDTIFHLASNSDIARAASEPLIDFDDGIRLTQMVLEAARLTGVKRILFTSGSGVYGDIPPEPIPEAYPYTVPISTYGAQKLASEAFISAYCHMFDMVGTVFRFANIVGPNMTHGVSHDFVRRLSANPHKLKILGDGNQSKPYVHSDDIINAILMMHEKQTDSFDCVNVAGLDSLLVNEIADIIIEEMCLQNVEYEYTGGARGWRADVPVYRLDSSRIRSYGWDTERNSKEAVTAAVRSVIAEIAAGR